MRCEYCSHRRSCRRIIGFADSCSNYNLSVTFVRKFKNLNIGDKIWILTDNNRREKLYNITIFEVDENFKSTGTISFIPNHTLNNRITKKYYCRSAFLTLEEAKQEIIDRGYTLNEVCEATTIDIVELPDSEYPNGEPIYDYVDGNRNYVIVQSNERPVLYDFFVYRDGNNTI